MYQRGEDRCQANVSASAAVSLRAPNDLAYMAAIVREMGMTPFLRDYPAENGHWVALEEDLIKIEPDVLVMSITDATIIQDLRAFREAKKNNPEIMTIAKGALFFSTDTKVFDSPEFSNMDFALVGESEFAISHLLEALQNHAEINDEALNAVPNIIYKNSVGHFVRTAIRDFEQDLDAMPFPARDLLRNELYCRPDSGEAMATIQTARGCPSKCIFCMTPLISGERVRSRSVNNIVDELQECVEKYGIRNFFFKADTFTINKKFVIELCQEVLKRNLDIAWVANSRVDTVDEERLAWMKKAGCWLVAFGFESGNDEMLKKMRKEATVADAYRASSLVRQAQMKVYGFFMVGLPWDNRETIEETFTLAENLDCDFYEIHMATPYEGTELYKTARALGLAGVASYGHDYFENSGVGSLFLSQQEILILRKAGLRRLYLSPKFIFKTLKRIRTPREFMNYASYGSRLIRNLMNG